MNNIAKIFHEKWIEEARKNNQLLRQLMWIISVMSWENEFNEEFESSDGCYICCPIQFSPIMQDVIDAINERVDFMVDYDELPEYVKDYYDFLIGGKSNE